jgi:hypothetical protein
MFENLADEFEERTMLDPKSREDPKLQELIKVSPSTYTILM